MDAGLNFNIHPSVDNKCFFRATWVHGEAGGGVKDVHGAGGAEDDAVSVLLGHRQIP